jgi:hypothetical protein
MKQETSNRKNEEQTPRQGQQGAAQEERSNAVKDPSDWVTGDEPMTGAQRSYLNTLAGEAGEPLEEDLSKADASRKIDELQQKTGRGLENDQQ